MPVKPKRKYDKRAHTYTCSIKPLVDMIMRICRKRRIPFYMLFVTGELDVVNRKGEIVRRELATIEEAGVYNQCPAEENARILALEELSARLEKEATGENDS